MRTAFECWASRRRSSLRSTRHQPTACSGGTLNHGSRRQWFGPARPHRPSAPTAVLLWQCAHEGATIKQRGTAMAVQPVTENVTFPSNGAQGMGYLARPDDSAAHPGVIVIQEWWGLEEHIKDV